MPKTKAVWGRRRRKTLRIKGTPESAEKQKLGAIESPGGPDEEGGNLHDEQNC